MVTHTPAAGPGRPPVPGARILVVEARFYDDLADELVRGALEVIAAAQATAEVLTVDGALEIPATVAIALEAAERAGRPFDAVHHGPLRKETTAEIEVLLTQDDARAGPSRCDRRRETRWA